MIAKLLQPWVDMTRFTVEWARYWLDWTETICDTIEDHE